MERGFGSEVSLKTSASDPPSSPSNGPDGVGNGSSKHAGPLTPSTPHTTSAALQSSTPKDLEDQRKQVATLKNLLSRSSASLQRTKAKLKEQELINFQLRERVEGLEGEVDLYRDAVGSSNVTGLNTMGGGSAGDSWEGVSRRVEEVLLNAAKEQGRRRSENERDQQKLRQQQHEQEQLMLKKQKETVAEDGALVSSLKKKIHDLEAQLFQSQSTISSQKKTLKGLQIDVSEARQIKAEGELMIQEAERRMKEVVRSPSTAKGDFGAAENEIIANLQKQNTELGNTIKALREWELERNRRNEFDTGGNSDNRQRSLGKLSSVPLLSSMSEVGRDRVLIYSEGKRCVVKAGEIKKIVFGNEKQNIIKNNNDSGVIRYEIHWAIAVSPKGCDVNFGITDLFKTRLLGSEGEKVDGVVALPDTNEEALALLNVGVGAGNGSKNNRTVEIILDNKHSWIKPKVCSIFCSMYGITKE